MARYCTELKSAVADPYPAERVPWGMRMAMAPLAAALWCVAYSPEWVTRLMSRGLAFLAGDVVRYRRRIVRRNIADCFPAMPEAGRRDVERGFYRNLADYFFQTVRLAHISERRLRRHIRFTGTGALAECFDRGQDVVLYTSHFGNWEYITSLALYMPEYGDVVFAHVNRPLKNLWFNRFFHRLRSRFNVSVPMRQTARAMMGWRREGQRFIIGFLSDQKPGRYTRSATVDFLGRPTPFIEGTEELARKLHTAVFYTDVHRTGRDSFEVRLVKMADDAAAMPPGELTVAYARILSRSIRRDPASYLWSHNRWRLPKKK